MSFSDLLSSGRGPGVIGLVMAVVVLLGFGLLFMFAFDEGLQGGGPTLAGTVRENDKSISSHKLRIEAAEEKLATIPALKATADKTRTVLSTNRSLETQIETRKSAIPGVASVIAETREVFESYKNTYRTFIRNSPDKRQLAALTTKDGTVYKDVDIRRITAVGIEIRHSDGQKRIGYEELPDDLQDYYQFDADQRIAEVQRESAEREQHNAAVAVAHEAAGAMRDKQLSHEQEVARQNRINAIAARQARLQTIAGEIRQLENDIVSADNQAAAARAAGRMHLSKVGTFRSQIGQKRAELNRVQGEIAQLQSQL